MHITAVLRIRIRIQIPRIHVFLGSLEMQLHTGAYHFGKVI
jgi:hypothetical protein